MKNDTVVYKTEADYQKLDENIEIAIHELFSLWKDPVNLGNPLDFLIKPGDRVVIKPNFVKESHLYNKDWEYIITHTVVIKMALTLAIKALEGTGEIYIVDAPQTDSDYNKIIKNVKLKELVDSLSKTTKTPIRYFDLREEAWVMKEGIIVRKKKLKGDPNGYINIDLKQDSEFAGKENMNYYGADYDTKETHKYHNRHQNIYVISKTVLSADVIINLPKFKTHKLGGITGALKNMVGTCIIKNSLPHHTVGNPSNKGDRYSDPSSKNEVQSKLQAMAQKVLKYKNPIINYPFIVLKKAAGLVFGKPEDQVIRNGNWHGNDTIWRTTLDLNKILYYADKEGKLQDTPRRKILSIVDGIIGGDGNGPMACDPQKSGVLIVGTNSLHVDTVAATLMGFDPQKIPTIKNGYKMKKYILSNENTDDISIASNKKSWNGVIGGIKKEETLRFTPHYGWKGYIEKNEDKG